MGSRLFRVPGVLGVELSPDQRRWGIRVHGSSEGWVSPLARLRPTLLLPRPLPSALTSPVSRQRR